MKKALLATGLSAAMAIPAITNAEPFRFAVVPDTQIYSWDIYRGDPRDWGPGQNDDPTKIPDQRGSAVYFHEQTQWLADNAHQMGIEHVVHLGDIVQAGGRIEEWQVADAAMSNLDNAQVTYSLVPGGHDAQKQGYKWQNYLDYFGPQRFEHYDNFGASDSGLNTYVIKYHEDKKILFLNLNLRHDDLDWAGQVLEDNRDAIAIVSIHNYVYDFRFGYGRNGEEIKEGPLRGVKLNSGSFDSDDFYREWVSKHPNIMMVQNGHVHGSFMQTSPNSAGLPIYEIQANWQDGVNGGQGYLRMYELDFDSKTMEATTYSPSLDRFRTDMEEFVDSIEVTLRNAGEIDELPNFVRKLVLDQFARSTVSDVNVIKTHPDYVKDPAYYEQQMLDLFGGELPVNFHGYNVDKLEDWEGLYMFLQALNPDRPLDYSSNFRTPNFSVRVDFDKYTQNLPDVDISNATSESSLKEKIFNGIGEAVDLLDVLFGSDNKSDLYYAQRGPASADYHEIRTQGGNYCLTVRNKDLDNNARVGLKNCDASATQRWRYMPDTNQIRNILGKCLDAGGGSGGVSKKSDINMYNCHAGSMDQKWIVEGNLIRSMANPDLVIDSEGGAKEGTNIQLYSVNYGGGQRWYRGNSYQELKSQHWGGSGRCLDIEGGKSKNGANVQVHKCHGGKNQQWHYDEVSGNIISAKGRCLDIPGDDNRVNSGANIQIWDCQSYAQDQKWIKQGNIFINKANPDLAIDARFDNENVYLNGIHGGLNQQWNKKAPIHLDQQDAVNIPGETELSDCHMNWCGATSGYLSLKDKRSGLCLDVKGGDSHNGNDVQLYSCNGSDAQLWRYEESTGYMRTLTGNKCLDNRGSTSKGSGFGIYDCVDSNNLRFDWDGNSLHPRRNSSLAMDAFGDDKGDTVGQWSYHGGDNQQWLWVQVARSGDSGNVITNFIDDVKSFFKNLF